MNLVPPDERICPHCLGYGFVGFDVPLKDPRFGRKMPCQVCAKGHQQQYLEKYSGLSDDMRTWAFENTAILPERQETLQFLQRLVSDVQGMVAIVGPYGTGKTRLLACTVNAAIAERRTAHYTTATRLLDHLRSAYNPAKKDIAYDSLWQLMQNASVLCIDEFNSYRPTAWAEEKFRELLDWRYRQRGEVATVLAGNLAMIDWPGWLRSRLQDRGCRVLEMSGADLRGKEIEGGVKT